MTGILLGILLILGGVVWALLVIMAAGMSSRPTDASDIAPAWLGVVAIVAGIGFVVVGAVT